MSRLHKTLLLGTLAVLGGALLLPAGAAASRAQWTVFEDHTALVKSPVEERIQRLNEIKELGVDTLRVEVKWNEVAPNPGSKTKPNFNASDPTAYASHPNAYPSFGGYDDLVRRAQALDLRVILTITGDAPRWATSGGRGTGRNVNYRPSPNHYAQFAAAVAKRYSGIYAGLPAVFYFTIWNEPNHRQFIKPTRSAPVIYRNLVDAAIPAIRAVNKNARIWIGETAPVGRAPKAMGPTEFLRKWLCLNKRFRRTSKGSGCRRFKKIDADGYAHHPYGPTSRVPKTRDVINMLAIRRLGKYLDQAARARRVPRKLPIYNTEFGLQSNPPDRAVSTSPVRQAQLINEKEEYSYRYGRLKSYSQYLLFDDPPRKGRKHEKWSGFQTGLRFSHGSSKGDRKPAYNAFKFPLVVKRRSRGVYVWGRVRPGTGKRSVQLQRKGAGNSGPRFKTNSRGYFTVKRRQSGRYRFRAYDSNGKLLGTSRTARPARLP
ncbi:MAG: cellulase family glycosylhydrolase [Solirubrobacterales bacterium]